MTSPANDEEHRDDGPPGSGGTAHLSTGALFLFRLREVWLAVEADAVEAVISSEAPTPIPIAPDHIEGVRLHGDNVVAVVDLARFLRLPETGPSSDDAGFSRTLIVSAGGLRAGLVCDRAAGVFQIDAAALEAPRVLTGERLLQFLSAEVDTPRGRAGVLDGAALLEAARVRE